jgi:hypothetical protein
MFMIPIYAVLNAVSYTRLLVRTGGSKIEVCSENIFIQRKFLSVIIGFLQHTQYKLEYL